MSQKTLLIAGAVLIVAAFLLGFVPQYRNAADAGTQLTAARAELAAEHGKSQMDELGLLIGYIYLETNLKNYGLASESSSKFFDRVRAMMSQTSDPARQTFLQSALTTRDAITGGLAKGDASTITAIQDLFQRTLDATQTLRQ